MAPTDLFLVEKPEEKKIKKMKNALSKCI